jgi:hypothetical protein
VGFVKNHVLKEFKDSQKVPHSQAASEHWATRRSALTEWSKKTYPLSYEEGFELLTTALAKSTLDVGKGLPQSHHQPSKISIEEFSNLLFLMGRPHESASLSPPLFTPSSLVDSLHVTVQMFICSMAKNQKRSTGDALAGYVRFTCNRLKINFGPWSVGGFPASGITRGKIVDRIAVPTIWMKFGQAPPPGMEVPQALMTNGDAVGYRLHMEKHRAINGDCRAEWTAGGVSLTDLSTFFKRTVNPNDLSLEAAGVGPNTNKLVLDTYEWVLKIFDIQNKVHQLVLFTAILFSKARPFIGWPSDAKIGAPIYDRENRNIEAQNLVWARYMCHLQWTDGRSGQNSLSEGQAFITMFVAYFLAYAGDDLTWSPLLNEILNGSGKLTGPWVSKQSGSLSYPSYFFVNLQTHKPRTQMVSVYQFHSNPSG